MDLSNHHEIQDPNASPAGPDLTFLIPFYDRLKHFKAYWNEGKWEGVRIQIVSDGSPPEIVDELNVLVGDRPDVALHAYSPNKGTARARAEGFEQITTTYVAACDDDDFIEEASQYAQDAIELFSRNDETLLVTAPFVVSFNESGASRVQYDRRWMDGMSGRRLLDFIVRSGEIQALMPSVFRTSDVRQLEVNELFERNQDLALLVRLCAAFPDRRIRVLNKARYMRLIHDNSISSRRVYSVEHLYNHALAMTVGAYHLSELGGISRNEFLGVLQKRGEVLQQAFGAGRDVFSVFASLLRGEMPRPSSDEGRETLAFVERDESVLPSEYRAFLPATQDSSSTIVVVQQVDDAQAVPERADAAEGDASQADNPQGDAAQADAARTYDSLKERALALHDNGDVLTAAQYLAEALNIEPDRKDAYLLLAMIHEKQGNSQSALDLLSRAASLDECDPQIQYALGILTEQLGDHASARQHFGVAVAEFDRLAAEIQAVADGAPPEQEAEMATHLDTLQPVMLDARKRLAATNSVSTNGKAELKIAIVCGPDQKFIKGIVERLRRNHDVRTIYVERERGHSGSFHLDLNQIQRTLDWADVAWFEWCDGILMHASKNLRKTSAVVCRLHSFEAFTELPQQIDWSFVDHVVFVAEHIREIVQESTLRLPKSSVVANGVDLEKIKFVERERDFKVAYVGYLNFKKNPELLLQVAAKLKEYDARYVVHVAGEFQERRYALYFKKMTKAMGLENNFRFYGWVDDIDSWLIDKSYIISTSLLEGCPVSLIEAMAKGLKPVIHNWPGAEMLYPSDYLFNTVDEAVARITSREYDSERYRAFVEERHDQKAEVHQIDALLRQLVGRGHHELNCDLNETYTPASQPGAVKRIGTTREAPHAKLITRKQLEMLRQEWGNSDWAATPDFLSEMVRLVSATDGPILECGSGLTTIVLGLLGKARQIPIWTLEHDYDWYSKLKGVLEKNGLGSVNLHHTPLKSFDGYDWFDAPMDAMPETFDLVVCDGPPGKSRGGRYGLLPQMASRLTERSVILVDDVWRTGEQEVVRSWSEQYGLSMQVHGTERSFGVLRFGGATEHVPGSPGFGIGSAEAAWGA